MRRLSIWILAIALGFAWTDAAPAQDSVRLTGSGASFPFPIYSTWFKAFSGKSKGVTVDYQGEGQRRRHPGLPQRTVDFAASDAAMTDEEIGQGRRGRPAAADDRRRDRARPTTCPASPKG